MPGSQAGAVVVAAVVAGALGGGPAIVAIGPGAAGGASSAEGVSAPPHPVTADARSKNAHIRYTVFTLSVHAPKDAPANVKHAMTKHFGRRARQLHEHTAVVAHALRQHAGIPYEVEQKVCTDCRTILDERTVRRAAA